MITIPERRGNLWFTAGKQTSLTRCDPGLVMANVSHRPWRRVADIPDHAHRPTPEKMSLLPSPVAVPATRSTARPNPSSREVGG
jgi:hypothetical protein